MIVYDRTFLKTTVATQMILASKRGVFDGILPSQYLRICTSYHVPSGTKLIFSRDVGMHASGWWKNPDYDSCLHLSLSFYDPITRESVGKDRKQTEEWLNLFFREHKNKLWCEPPYTKLGKVQDTWHYRLFCVVPGWHPIVPRGEVYSRELTVAGWKSYSDVEADLAAERAKKLEMLK